MNVSFNCRTLPESKLNEDGIEIAALSNGMAFRVYVFGLYT